MQVTQALEQLLKDNAEKLPDNVSTEVKEAVDKVNEALKGEDIEAVKSSLEELNQKAQAIGQALYAESQAAEAGDGFTEAAQAGMPSEDDVVDAEIVDEDENK